MIDQFREYPIIPIYYNDDSDKCIKALELSYKSGFMLFEFVNRGAKALKNFKVLQKHRDENFPQLKLGIGTIKNAEEAKLFISENCDFIVSPIIDSKIAAICKAHEILYIPGCMTPTEINTAEQLGCYLVKLFPADHLGTKYLKAIQPLFPNVQFMATGGLNLKQETLDEWFNAGILSVGIGSALFPKDKSEDDIIKDNAERLAYIKKIANGL